MSEKQNNKEIQEEVITPYTRKPRTDFTRKPSNPGDDFVYMAELSIVDGEQVAKPGKKVDWRAYIEASRKSCDLHNIVARYLQGDATVVNVGNPIYGDVAAMPKNVNELQDLATRTQASFNAMSDEIKGIFHGSFEEFYNCVLNNTVDQKIQAYASAKVEAAKAAAQAQAEAGKEE